MLDIIGKIEQIQEQKIRVTTVLLLNQIINKGIIDIMGVICKIIKKGEIDFSMILLKKIINEIKLPKNADIKIADKVIEKVTRAALKKSYLY